MSRWQHRSLDRASAGRLCANYYHSPIPTYIDRYHHHTRSPPNRFISEISDVEDVDMSPEQAPDFSAGVMTLENVQATSLAACLQNPGPIDMHRSRPIRRSAVLLTNYYARSLFNNALLVQIFCSSTSSCTWSTPSCLLSAAIPRLTDGMTSSSSSSSSSSISSPLSPSHFLLQAPLLESPKPSPAIIRAPDPSPPELIPVSRLTEQSRYFNSTTPHPS